MIIYVYIKQHSITGIKYFGITRSINPFKYKGSGLYWLRHIKKYGNFIKTTEVWGFDDQGMCTEFALTFSKKHNIVESEEWANLKEENALDGNVKGNLHSEVTRAKISLALKGRTHSKESIRKMSENRKNKTKGKTYEELYGIEKAKEMKQARSELMRKNRLSGKIIPHQK